MWGNKFLYGVIVLWCITGAYSAYQYITRYDQYMSFVVLDVGQGSGTFVSAPDSQVLIDVGLNKQTLRELSHYMPWWDRYIDFMALSHPDQDHVGAVPLVFERYQIGQTLMTRKSADTNLFRRIICDLASHETRISFTRSGQRIQLRDDYTIDVLWPEKTLNLNETERNDTSIVLHIHYGETSFLVMGDAGVDVEEKLLARYGERLQSDVLVVGHHGSRTSTSRRFVQTVNPQYAVISVGIRNRYGHPHERVLDTLRDAGAIILRTDRDGTVRFISDGAHLLVQ